MFLLVLQPLFERLVGAMSPKFRLGAFRVLAVLFVLDIAATVVLSLR